MAWQELVIEGGERKLADFLSHEAQGLAVLREADLDLEPASFLDRLRHLLDLPFHHLLFAAPEGAAELVRRLAAHPGLELQHRYEVAAASFRFTAHPCSEKAAARVQAAIHTPLPSGVALADFEERESRDPQAREVELYSPVHPYEYRAGGRVHGDLAGVAAVHRRMTDLDFLDPGKIELEVREITPRP